MPAVLYGIMLLLAQQGTIYGWVRAEVTREPIPYAAIAVEGAKTVVADAHGYFVVAGLTAGRARLEASMLGYEAVQAEVTVPSGGSVRLDFLLPLQPVRLEGIRATAGAEETPAAATPGPPPIRLDAPTLNLVPALAEKDAFRALQLLPSVAAASDFSSALYVRGGSPDQNLVLLDGAPIFNPYHVGGLFSAIDPDAITTLEIVPGGIPATDGDRASSVVKIWTRDGGRDRLRAHGALGLVSSRLGVDGPLPTTGGSYLVSARRTYLDAVTGAAHEMGMIDMAFPYAFTDAHAKLTQDVGATGRLNLSGYLNDERIHTTHEMDDDGVLGFSWGTRAGSAAYRQPFGGVFLAELTLAATSFDGDFDAVELNQAAPPDTTLVGRITMRDLMATARLTWYGRGHDLKAGVQLDAYDFRYRFRLNGIELTDPDANDGTFGGDLFPRLGEAVGPVTVAGYVEDEWTPSPSFAVRLGARALRSPGLGTEIMPRVGLRWSLTPRLSLTAGAGRYAQAIHSLRDEEAILASIIPYELLVPASAETGYLVAEDVVAGAEYAAGGARLRAEVYYKRYPSLPTPPLSDDPMNAPIFAPEFVRGTGRATGLEVTAQARRGKTTLMGSYALNWSQRTADGVSYTPRYNRRHLLDVTAGYAWGDSGLLTARLAAGTGQPYTPGLAAIPAFYWDPESTAYRNVWFDRVVLGEHNSNRLPGYLRLDVGARREVTRHWFGRDVVLAPYAQILNVLNTRNVTSGQPQYSTWTTAKLEYLPGVPVLPTFGIEWRF